MSEINFNITDNTYPYDCLYHDTYGYRACLNGRRFDIAKIETVLALRDNFGLPDLNIKAEDVERFEKCIYWHKKKTSQSKSFSKNVSWCSLKLRYSAINSRVFLLSGISSFGIISLDPIEP